MDGGNPEGYNNLLTDDERRKHLKENLHRCKKNEDNS